MVFAILSCVIFSFTFLMILRVPSLKINKCACFTGDMQDLLFSQWCS